MTSWIVPFVQKNKDDPLRHTNQHELKHSCLELDPTFEAKPVKKLNLQSGGVLTLDTVSAVDGI